MSEIRAHPQGTARQVAAPKQVDCYMRVTGIKNPAG